MIEAAGINHRGYEGLWSDAEWYDFEKAVTASDT
jgi:hypothetical protein